MEIKDILALPAKDAIKELQNKTIRVRPWEDLEKEYDPSKHKVMDKTYYPDLTAEDGKLDYVSRVTFDLERLATKRITEMMFGVPVKRVYKPENDTQKQYAAYIEAIFQKARIDAVNLHRSTRLFASCECATIWYAVEQPNSLYGFDSKVKIRCKTYSPMDGDALYPYFDEFGDLTAFSVQTQSKIVDDSTIYFDTYTPERHLRYTDKGDGWTLETDEQISIGKIPVVYINRPTPVWEDTSTLRNELEWAISRNGNYLRKNSKPLFAVFSEEVIEYGKEKSEREESKGILQFPSGANAQYITWNQPTDNLKFYMDELRTQFFTTLQIPDFSYEKMKSTPMSGESRKQVFIDAQLKVIDESGRWMELADREVNVVKALLAQILPSCNVAELDKLKVESVITPYTMNENSDSITYLMRANGGKPLMSQQESIAHLGWSDDVDNTMKLIQQEAAAEAALEQLADSQL